MSTKIKLELLKLQAEHAEMHNDLIELIKQVITQNHPNQQDSKLALELAEKWTKI